VKQEGRRFYYQVAERLYNIYHLMRQSSDASERACAVVEFMVRFYDPDLVACAIARDACIGKEIKRLMEYVPPHLTLPDKMIPATGLKELLKKDDIKRLIKEDSRKIIETLNKIIESLNINDNELDLQEIAGCYMLKATIYYLNNELEEAITTCDEVISRFGDHDNSEILTQVARALFYKGVVLGMLEKAEESIAAYEEVVFRFGDHNNPEILAQVTNAKNGKAWAIYCLNNKERFPEALSWAKSAQKSDPENSKISHTIAMISGALNQWEEAFQFARISLSDKTLIECRTTDIIEFFVLAAAHGMANDALKLLEKHPAASAKLEPLVVALKMKAQKELSAPQEVAEVGMDILKQIENTENAENQA
jgi:tetratricopeptide (TPR) repeat protein